MLKSRSHLPGATHTHLVCFSVNKAVSVGLPWRQNPEVTVAKPILNADTQEGLSRQEGTSQLLRSEPKPVSTLDKLRQPPLDVFHQQEGETVSMRGTWRFTGTEQRQNSLLVRQAEAMWLAWPFSVSTARPLTHQVACSSELCAVAAEVFMSGIWLYGETPGPGLLSLRITYSSLACVRVSNLMRTLTS